jgi:hypothetical protein
VIRSCCIILWIRGEFVTRKCIVLRMDYRSQRCIVEV